MCIKMTRDELVRLVKEGRKLNYYKCKNCNYILLVSKDSDTIEWTCCHCGLFNSLEKIEIIEDVLPSG